MRSGKTVKLRLLALGAAILLLTGCYDRTETEDRRYVVLMGIDSGESEIPDEYKVLGGGGKYIMSVGEARPESETGSENEEQKTAVVSGDTIPEIKKLADKYSDKEIYFGQLKAAVLGRGVVTDGDRLAETICNIERMEDINTKVVVFAADSTAIEAVETVMSKDTKGGLYLWDYYKNNDADADMKEYMDFENLIKCMRQNETFIIPIIKTEDGEILLNGGCIIKNGQYAGDITDEDIVSVKWFEGNAKGETVSTEDMTARVKKQSIKTHEENGVTTVDIKAECSLESGFGADTKYIEDRLETVIKTNLENTINKALESDADFTGLGVSGDIVINADVKIISTGVIK